MCIKKILIDEFDFVLLRNFIFGMRIKYDSK